MYRAHTSFLLIAAFLWSMSPAEATVLVPASFKEMVQEATVIAHGHVALVVPQWAPGRRRIESLVTIEIANTLKGVQRWEALLALNRSHDSYENMPCAPTFPLLEFPCSLFFGFPILET